MPNKMYIKPQNFTPEFMIMMITMAFLHRARTVDFVPHLVLLAIWEPKVQISLNLCGG